MDMGYDQFLSEVKKIDWYLDDRNDNIRQCKTGFCPILAVFSVVNPKDDCSEWHNSMARRKSWELGMSEPLVDSILKGSDSRSSLLDLMRPVASLRLAKIFRRELESLLD